MPDVMQIADPEHVWILFGQLARRVGLNDEVVQRALEKALQRAAGRLGNVDEEHVPS
jgi:hypothetical protein